MRTLISRKFQNVVSIKEYFNNNGTDDHFKEMPYSKNHNTLRCEARWFVPSRCAVIFSTINSAKT